MCINLDWQSVIEHFFCSNFARLALRLSPVHNVVPLPLCIMSPNSQFWTNPLHDWEIVHGHQTTPCCGCLRIPEQQKGHFSQKQCHLVYITVHSAPTYWSILYVCMYVYNTMWDDSYFTKLFGSTLDALCIIQGRGGGKGGGFPKMLAWTCFWVLCSELISEEVWLQRKFGCRA